MRPRLNSLAVLGGLLCLEAAVRLQLGLEGYRGSLGYFRNPPVPAWGYEHLQPRFQFIAFGWGLYPLLAGAAGLFTGIATLRRWAGWPLLASVASGIYAGVGLDGLYWDGPMDVKLILGVGWKEGFPGFCEGLWGLSRNLLAFGASFAAFVAMPWRARLGGPSEAPAPKHPSLFWVSFLSGLTLTLVVAETTRRVSASMGRW